MNTFVKLLSLGNGVLVDHIHLDLDFTRSVADGALSCAIAVLAGYRSEGVFVHLARSGAFGTDPGIASLAVTRFRALGDDL